MENSRLQSVIIDNKHYINVINNEFKIRDIAKWKIDFDCITNFIKLTSNNTYVMVTVCPGVKDGKPISSLKIRTMGLGKLEDIIELTNKIELIFDNNTKYTIRDIITLSNMDKLTDKIFMIGNVEVDMTYYIEYELSELFKIYLRLYK